MPRGVLLFLWSSVILLECMPLGVSHSDLVFSGTWCVFQYVISNLYFNKFFLNYSSCLFPSVFFSGGISFLYIKSYLPAFNISHFFSNLFYPFLHFLSVFFFLTCSLYLLCVPCRLVFISEIFSLISWAMPPHCWVSLILVPVVLSCPVSFPSCPVALVWERLRFLGYFCHAFTICGCMLLTLFS